MRYEAEFIIIEQNIESEAKMSVLQGLKPEKVFHYFEEISKIPRQSGNTGKISDYLVQFAKDRELEVLQDPLGNVVIRKPGTTGYEDSPWVMLQGHMDMICEKEDDCRIDFQKEGIPLEVRGNIITARGTTLGGDNGIALAYGLAILDADDIPHPPIEAVFTVDEEVGLVGAAALDKSLLKSSYMMNLDSEEEGHLLVSCAGGATVDVHLPRSLAQLQGQEAELVISGLIGGHSGMDVDKGRINANVQLGRLLRELKKQFDFRLLSVNGGTKDNVISKKAAASLAFLPGTNLKAVAEAVDKIGQTYRKENLHTDPDVTVTLREIGPAKDLLVMDKNTTDKVITLLSCLPAGIQRMSFEIPGLVQTSLNLGVLTTEEKEIIISYSVRSSVGSEKDDLISRIECLADAMGAYVTISGAYPAWEYKEKSPLRDLMIQVYKEMYGCEPLVEAMHAGVECGFFEGAMPELDAISFGPDLRDVHTPAETMDIDSVGRTWDYLLEVLKRIK